MIRRVCGVVAIGAAFTLIAASAGAATVTDHVTFSATGFYCYVGCPTPVDPVTGSFTITFDPTQTYTDATTGITLNNLNIALGSSLAFDYSPIANSDVEAGELVVGGIENTVNSLQYSPSTNDFYLQILNFTTSPTFQQLGYTQTSAGDSSYYYTTTVGDGDSVAVTPVVATPEPATWALLLAGIGMMGGFLRVARRRAAALA